MDAVKLLLARTVEPQSYEPLGIFEVRDCISLKLMEF